MARNDGSGKPRRPRRCLARVAGDRILRRREPRGRVDIGADEAQ